MNYQRIYNELIEKSKGRISTNETEKHHIIPDCYFIESKRNAKLGIYDGDPDDPSNIAILTRREHFVAHLLLAKIYGGVMIYTAFRMSGYRKYSSHQYEWLRKQHVEQMQNREISDETRQKISIARTGSTASPETKAKMSASRKGESNGMFGKTHTPEAIENMKELLKAQIECPYCGKVGGMTIMQRWHFENCKMSPNYVAPPKMKRKPSSDETIEKIKNSLSKRYADPNWVNPSKGKPKKADHQCQYCGIISGKGQITRWHNENCKQKPNSSE